MQCGRLPGPADYANTAGIQTTFQSINYTGTGANAVRSWSGLAGYWTFTLGSHRLLPSTLTGRRASLTAGSGVSTLAGSGIASITGYDPTPGSFVFGSAFHFVSGAATSRAGWRLDDCSPWPCPRRSRGPAQGGCGVPSETRPRLRPLSPQQEKPRQVSSRRGFRRLEDHPFGDGPAPGTPSPLPVVRKTVLFPRSDSLGGVLRKTLGFLPRGPLATYLGAFLEDF